MTKLSVCIITFNEERNIVRCLDSVKNIADEIIVLDSMSTDKTEAICKLYAVKFIQQPFLGYIEQKNKALTFANNHFILSLDADESLDIKLQRSISEWKKLSNPMPCKMNRCANYCGKFIRYGSWYPDKKLRIFNKTKAYWGGENPHDRVIFKKNEDVKHLKGDILHYSFYSLEEHVAQNNKFSSLSALELFKKNEKAGIVKLLINPFLSFFKSYFLRMGFLDGFYGFIIAKNIAHLTFLKYSKLMQLHLQNQD